LGSFPVPNEITTTKKAHLFAWRRAVPFIPLLGLLLPWSRLLLLLLLAHHPRWTVLPLQLLSTSVPLFPARYYPILEERS